MIAICGKPCDGFETIALPAFVVFLSLVALEQVLKWLGVRRLVYRKCKRNENDEEDELKHDALNQPTGGTKGSEA
jgi:hypothetical protein